MTSAPETASAMEPGSMKSTRAVGHPSGTMTGDEVERSKAITSAPLDSSSPATWLPRNPEAPVTTVLAITTPESVDFRGYPD